MFIHTHIEKSHLPYKYLYLKRLVHFLDPKVNETFAFEDFLTFLELFERRDEHLSSQLLTVPANYYFGNSFDKGRICFYLAFSHHVAKFVS